MTQNIIQANQSFRYLHGYIHNYRYIGIKIFQMSLQNPQSTEIYGYILKMAPNLSVQQIGFSLYLIAHENDKLN